MEKIHRMRITVLVQYFLFVFIVFNLGNSRFLVIKRKTFHLMNSVLITAGFRRWLLAGFILAVLLGVLLYQLFAPGTALRYYRCSQGSIEDSEMWFTFTTNDLQVFLLILFKTFLADITFYPELARVLIFSAQLFTQNSSPLSGKLRYRLAVHSFCLSTFSNNFNCCSLFDHDIIV